MTNLRILVLRVTNDIGVNDIRYIRVCYQKSACDSGLDTRSFTGIGLLPTVVAEQVHGWFKHELDARVPRSKMARGAFSFGTLVKLVARQGLNLIDVDQVFGRDPPPMTSTRYTNPTA